MDTSKDFLIKNHNLIKYVGSDPVVFVPEGITTIKPFAFAESTCQKVFLPCSLTTVEHMAFYRCSQLTELLLPDQEIEFGDTCFLGCHALADPDGFVIVRHHLFDYCGNGGDITIPQGVTVIHDAAFYDKSRITSVTMPNSVLTIGEEAFGQCNSLTSVTFSENLKLIRPNAFNFCSHLKHLNLSPDFKNISKWAFSGCNALADENGLIIVNGLVFDYIGNEAHVTIPDGVTVLTPDCFSDKKSLHSVICPDSVTAIEEAAFIDCQNLTTVHLGKGLKTIGASVFERCEKLQSITFQDGLTSIGNNAFRHCSGLTNISLPDTVTLIEKEAFRGCCCMTRFVLPPLVTTIHRQTFCDCYELTELVLNEGLNAIHSLAMNNCVTLSKVVLPKSLRFIGAHAFRYCRMLHDVVIPEGVTCVESYAFSFCDSLHSLKIPHSVTSLGSNLVAYSQSLIDLSLPKGLVHPGPVLENAGMILKILAPGAMLTGVQESAHKVALCVGYLCHPECYEDPQVIANYLPYIRRQKKAVLRNLVLLDLVDGLATLMSLLTVSPATFEQTFLQLALAADAKQCVIFLMDWSKNHIPADPLAHLSLKALDEPVTAADLRKLWTYEKLPDGSVCITGYKGTELNITVPSRIGRAAVTQIAHQAFHPDRPGLRKARQEVYRSLRSITLPHSIRFTADPICLPTVILTREPS